MTNYDIAFDETMGIEGGYANDKDDTGGQTVFGLTRRDNPKASVWPIVDDYIKKYGLEKAIPLINKDQKLKAQAKIYYKPNYWDVNKLDQITNVKITTELFDTGVNMGVVTAAKFLQEALNLTNNAGKLYSNIVVDGKIGPITLGLVNKHPRPQVLLNTLNLLQGEKYLKIMRNNEIQEKFWNSWCSRVLVTR